MGSGAKFLPSDTERAGIGSGLSVARLFIEDQLHVITELEDGFGLLQISCDENSFARAVFVLVFDCTGAVSYHYELCEKSVISFVGRQII
jgi:hypothetical protein